MFFDFSYYLLGFLDGFQHGLTGIGELAFDGGPVGAVAVVGDLSHASGEQSVFLHFRQSGLRKDAFDLGECCVVVGSRFIHSV